MPFVSTNPATGQPLGHHRVHRPREALEAVDKAHRAFLGWRELALSARSRHLRAVARTLRSQRDRLATLITAEMGKPIAQARDEIEKCAGCCAFYARHGAAGLADERPPNAPRGARVEFAPLGVVLAIMPWNFPFWQAFRAAAPALMAGNTLLLKHASNVTGCAVAIERVFSDAGLPAGVFQTLVIGSERVPALIHDARVAAVTLTGSTEAGRHVAAEAGAALKPAVLELGGSDPSLILADADLDLAAEICARSRLTNTGQSCICAKRFIVVESVRAKFTEKLLARLAARRLGDPTDEATQLGPLARADLRTELHRQVTASVRRGAKLLLGGKIPRGAGYFYPATALADVRQGMPAYDEELFGPVAAIIPVADEREAIAVANDTRYGLGAALFTQDRRRARELAREIEAGMVFINDFVRSDSTLPFGGIKESGFGRELGLWGLRSFVNVKTVVAR